VIVESNNSDITFGSSGGTATLADGKTVTVEATNGFTTGDLKFKNFTQTGTTAQSLTLTGDAKVYFGTGSTWNAALTVNSPRLYLNGSTFNGTSSFTKNATGYDNSDGGNTFNGTTTITISIHTSTSLLFITFVSKEVNSIGKTLFTEIDACVNGLKEVIAAEVFTVPAVVFPVVAPFP